MRWDLTPVKLEGCSLHALKHALEEQLLALKAAQNHFNNNLEERFTLQWLLKTKGFLSRKLVDCTFMCFAAVVHKRRVCWASAGWLSPVVWGADCAASTACVTGQEGVICRLLLGPLRCKDRAVDLACELSSDGSTFSFQVGSSCTACCCPFPHGQSSVWAWWTNSNSPAALVGGNLDAVLFWSWVVVFFLMWLIRCYIFLVSVSRSFISFSRNGSLISTFLI